jgi:hypothetical protein
LYANLDLNVRNIFFFCPGCASEIVTIFFILFLNSQQKAIFERLVRENPAIVQATIKAAESLQMLSVVRLFCFASNRVICTSLIPIPFTIAYGANVFVYAGGTHVRGAAIDE